MVKSVECFICPYCDEKFDDEYDAEDCAEQCCLKYVDPISIKSQYQCEICDARSYHRDEIMLCEAKHEEDEDQYYEFYLESLARLKLEEAARHPSQTHINIYLIGP